MTGLARRPMDADDGWGEPWVRLALATPRWSREERERATALLAGSVHLGEVAEAMGCSVLVVQAELGIGPRHEVRSYRKLRGCS